MKQWGRFITFEGLEGAGKSTQVARMGKMLRRHGIEAVITHEPGGTPVAEKIRSILLIDKDIQRSGVSEAFLFSIARLSHTRQRILPALKAGKWVICDRFADTTRAYQGGGRCVPSWLIEMLIRLTAGPARPDLTIILDISPESICSRLQNRAKMNNFDREDMDFFKRARAAYQGLVQAQPKRVRLIDAERPLAEVTDQVDALIAQLIRETPTP